MVISENELKRLQTQANAGCATSIWQDIGVEAVSSILTALFVYYVIKKHK